MQIHLHVVPICIVCAYLALMCGCRAHRPRPSCFVGCAHSSRRPHTCSYEALVRTCGRIGEMALARAPSSNKRGCGGFYTTALQIPQREALARFHIALARYPAPLQMQHTLPGTQSIVMGRLGHPAIRTQQWRRKDDTTQLSIDRHHRIVVSMLVLAGLLW